MRVQVHECPLLGAVCDGDRHLSSAGLHRPPCSAACGEAQAGAFCLSLCLKQLLRKRYCVSCGEGSFGDQKFGKGCMAYLISGKF